MDLFTHAQARAEAEKGISRSADTSGARWAKYAYDYLCEYARNNSQIFPPDLWGSGLRVPSSPRAMGAVIQRAIKSGIMKPIKYQGMICCRENPLRHNATTPVYESLIYGNKHNDLTD